MTDKEIDKIIKANIKMAGFISLVKRMREVQIELEDYDSCDGLIDLSKKVINLESEVDEYLKKM